MSRWLCGLVLLLVMTVPAHAVIIDLVQSLGGHMAMADCVVRGVVIRCEHVDSGGLAAYSYWKITVRVRETLRGVPVQEVVVYDVNRAEWTKSSEEQLLFLETGGGHHRSDPFWNSVDWIERDALDLSLAEPRFWGEPVVTDDLRLLRTSDEILAETRRLGAALPASVQQTMILPPKDIKERLGITGWVMLAVDEDSFAGARQWVVSGDAELEWCGTELLIHSHAPADLLALEKFARKKPKSVPYYDEHAKALLLAYLNKAGIRGLPSIVESTAEPLSLRQSGTLLSCLGILMLPVAYVAVRRRRARLLVLSWLLVVGLVVTFDARSYWSLDAMTWGDHDLALERGVVYLYRHNRAANGLPSPLAYCRPEDLIRALKYNFVGSTVPSELNNFGHMSFPYYEGVHTFEQLADRPFGFFTPWYARRWFNKFSGPVWNVPIWGVLIGLGSPFIFVLGRRMWRHFKARRARGFPVQVARDSVDITQRSG